MLLRTILLGMVLRVEGTGYNNIYTSASPCAPKYKLSKDIWQQGKQAEETLVEICFRKIWKWITALFCCCTKAIGVTSASKDPTDIEKFRKILDNPTWAVFGVLDPEHKLSDGNPFDTRVPPCDTPLLHELLQAEGEHLPPRFGFPITLDMIKILVEEKRVNLKIRDGNGREATHFAKAPETYTYLLEEGADPNPQDEEGKSPLFFIKNPDLVQIMLTRNVTTVSPKKQTPLHSLKSPELTDQFIHAGLKVNEQDVDGNTPLHKVSSLAVAEKFIQSDADHTIENNAGQIPFETAEKPEVFTLLLSLNPSQKYKERKLENLFLSWRDDSTSSAEQLIDIMLENGADLPTRIQAQSIRDFLLDTIDGFSFSLIKKHMIPVSGHPTIIRQVLNEALKFENVIYIDEYVEMLEYMIDNGAKKSGEELDLCLERLEKIQMGSVEGKFNFGKLKPIISKYVLLKKTLFNIPQN